MSGSLKNKYTEISNKIEALKTTDRLMILLVSILLPPFIFFNFIFFEQTGKISIATKDLKVDKPRFEKLEKEVTFLEKISSEIGLNEPQLINKIQSLVWESSQGDTFITRIDECAKKNELKIKYTKRGVNYNGAYEKICKVFDAGNANAELGVFKCVMLPVELAFRASADDIMVFLNVLEGFKNVNYLTKKISIIRTDDGNCDFDMTLEFLNGAEFNQ